MNRTLIKLIQLSAMILIAVIAVAVENASAGDISIGIGENLGPVPKGEYIDQFDETWQSKYYGYSLNYMFEMGLVIGYEEFSSSSKIRDDPDDFYLIVTSRGYSVGYAMGDAVRFVVKAGIPGKISVQARENMNYGTGGDALDSQDIDSTWFAVSLDWGPFEKDGTGLGIAFDFRMVTATADDLFDSQQDFDASGLFFGGVLRYRF